MVEQLTVNQWVPGSSPGRGAKNEKSCVLYTAFFVSVNRTVNPHGFRTTLRVWGADQQHPKDAMEFQIAHKLKDKVEAAYNRSNLLEVRRGIMDQWVDLCTASS